jgi:hypothetical protein
LNNNSVSSKYILVPICWETTVYCYTECHK